MSNIRVDIEELEARLEQMKEDDYVTVELEIEEDQYSKELHLSAVSFDSDDILPYGSLGEVSNEL